MEKADPSRADQPEPSAKASAGRRLSAWGLVVVWGGRALVFITVGAVLASWLTHPWWAAEGWDPKGFPRSWVPNVTLGLVLVSSLFAQWLCGLAAPPSAAWRKGDYLMADSVIGRRRIWVPNALVIPFRVPGRGGTAHGAFVIGRGLRLLVLLSPVATGGRSRIERLVGRRVPDTRVRSVVEYLVGFLWLLLTIAFVFVLIGLVGWWIGMFRS